jgi:lysophosphatidylcholine acyltransferase/lyso-PAF acetyltransferase
MNTEEEIPTTDNNEKPPKLAKRRSFIKKSVRRFANNPFIYIRRESERGFYKIFKLVVGYLILMPIRFLLFLISLVLMVLICVIANIGVKLTPTAKYTRFGFVLMKLVPLLFKLTLFSLGYIKIKKTGKSVNGSVAPIVVVNHVSIVDAMALFGIYGVLSPVSKEEIKKIPVIGFLLSAFRAVTVNRVSAQSRHDTLEMIGNRAKLNMQTHLLPQILIFPEGTTTNGNSLVSFKPGAFIPGLPVQPVCLKYKFKYLDPSWSMGGPGMVGMMFKMMAQFRNELEITILDPYIPNEQERQNPSLYANNVRNEMAKSLGFETTEHSYEDVLLLYQAAKVHEPLEAINVEINSIKKLYNLSLDQAKDLLKKFALEDKDHKGKLDLNDFAHMLGLPVTDRIVNLFQTFDKDGDGTIDFKEFLLGLTILNQKEDSSKKEIIESSFHIFDESGTGYIKKDDFKIVLKRNFDGITDEHIDKIFVDMDKDLDSRITHEEFAIYANSHPEYIFLAEEALRIRKEKEKKVEE